MAFATSELIWIRSFLASLGIFPGPMTLYCDSQAALHVARNPVFHKWTKHIEIDSHFVWEKLEAGILRLADVGTTQQPANILTKALSTGKFQYLKGKLAILDLHAPTWEGVLR